MDRNQLIEDAAKAIGNTWAGGAHPNRTMEELNRARAEAAFAVFEGAGSFLPVASDVQETAHTDDEREASLDSERLRQIAEWLRMEIGHEETAKRVDLIADRHDRLAAGFLRTVQGATEAPNSESFGSVQGEPSDEVVIAALGALMPEVNWSGDAMSEANPTWVEKMRAALRASANII